MSLIPSILRLLLLLSTPLWLSLMVEGFGLRWSLSPLLSGWLHTQDVADPALIPPPGWRESTYLTANPDVAAAVRNGVLPNGYAHYVQTGRAENRPGGLSPPPNPAPAAVPVAALVTTDTAVSPPSGQDTSPPEPAPVAAELLTIAQPPAAPASSPSTLTPLAPSSVKPAAIPHILRIRTGNSEDAIRVVLDLDRPARFNPPLRKPDGSLVVALPGTRWKAGPIGRLPLTSLAYRVEEAGGVSRLTIRDEAAKGKGGLSVKAIFTLPPDADRGHRLVIDVAPPKPNGKGGQAEKPVPQARS